MFKGDFSKFIYNSNGPTTLTLIDIFDCVTNCGDKDGSNIVIADLKIEYENLKKYFEGKNVQILKGRSDVVLKNLPDNFFDLIYIDADHSYESVYNDLKMSYIKLKNNGILCGHDYNMSLYPQVVSAVNDFCKHYDLHINYLTKDKLPTFGITKI